MIKAGRVACADGGHTDEITYACAPQCTWIIRRHCGKWATVTFSPQHVLQCQRHDAPIYINIEDQAGVRVGDIRMLEHPEYLAAIERQARKLAELPVLSPRSVDATADGWAMADGVVVARGTYRMDVGASVPHILIAP